MGSAWNETRSTLRWQRNASRAADTRSWLIFFLRRRNRPASMKQKVVAVIGGGSAGLTAARTAHKLGAKVLFFMGDNADRASLCVNAGCMPSKAMFEPIDAMHHARRHGWLEVEPRRPNEFLAEIVRWKDREIAQFRAYRQTE